MSEPQVQQVQPQPRPQNWLIVPQQYPNGIKAVMVQILTELGPLHFWLEPQAAKEIAAHLERAAVQAGTGLILPGPNGVGR